MSEIVELVYASRATFAPAAGNGGVEPEVGRILAQSRRNNPRQNVGGVLCYSDGFFFQCLEGEPDEVEAVFKRIAQDPRHRDVKILSSRTVPRRRFLSWSMKYAPVDGVIRQLLETTGTRGFDPYAFDADTIRRLVTLLHVAADPAARPEPAPPNAHRPQPGRGGALLAGSALSVAVGAMAVALLALYRTLG